MKKPLNTHPACQRAENENGVSLYNVKLIACNDRTELLLEEFRLMKEVILILMRLIVLLVRRSMLSGKLRIYNYVHRFLK